MISLHRVKDKITSVAVFLLKILQSLYTKFHLNIHEPTSEKWKEKETKNPNQLRTSETFQSKMAERKEEERSSCSL
jgi:hypothetical protein